MDDSIADGHPYRLRTSQAKGMSDQWKRCPAASGHRPQEFNCKRFALPAEAFEEALRKDAALTEAAGFADHGRVPGGLRSCWQLN